MNRFRGIDQFDLRDFWGYPLLSGFLQDALPTNDEFSLVLESKCDDKDYDKAI